MRCGTSLRFVSAKETVPSDLLLCEQGRRAKVRGEMNVAKCRATPFNLGQHHGKTLGRHGPGTKCLLQGPLTRDESLSLGNGVRAHALVDRAGR